MFISESCEFLKHIINGEKINKIKNKIELNLQNYTSSQFSLNCDNNPYFYNSYIIGFNSVQAITKAFSNASHQIAGIDIQIFKISCSSNEDNIGPQISPNNNLNTLHEANETPVKINQKDKIVNKNSLISIEKNNENPQKFLNRKTELQANFDSLKIKPILAMTNPLTNFYSFNPNIFDFSNKLPNLFFPQDNRLKNIPLKPYNGFQ